MIENICSLPTYQHLLIIFLVQFVLGCIDVYLSKNDEVKSNSIADFIFNIFATVAKRIFKMKGK